MPAGRNQYGVTLKADDPTLRQALEKYHREKLTNNKVISERLKAEYGIEMSAPTVKRRRRELALKGSISVKKDMPAAELEQLVLQELDKDPARRQGVRTIMHSSEGFDLHQPCMKKILRFPKHPIGPNERWAADGHDNLKAIDFPIYGFVDDATGKFLGLYVVPNNRDADIVSYLFLDVVERQGGIPMQLSTDCGSETLVGIVTALRERFCPQLDNNVLPAHVYLHGTHNISTKSGWARMRSDFTDNAIVFYKAGIDDGKCDLDDANQRELCGWLWGTLLQQEADKFVEFRNGVRTRRMHNKPGPSGMSRNQAFSLPETWGGRNCLIPVDQDLIRTMKAELGGEALLNFTSAEFSRRAQAVFDSLHVAGLSYENVWVVFTVMYSLMFHC